MPGFALAVLALGTLVTGLGTGAWSGRGAARDEGPDLRIANVFPWTPGGLCAGRANTFQVMIRNVSRVPVEEVFVVRLHILLPGDTGNVAHRDRTVRGIGSLEVKSVLFRNVELLEGLHAVTAAVDATNRVAERPAGAEANNGFPGAGQAAPTPNVVRTCAATT